jgi:hypothetical protein
MGADARIDLSISTIYRPIAIWPTLPIPPYRFTPSNSTNTTGNHPPPLRVSMNNANLYETVKIRRIRALKAAGA